MSRMIVVVYTALAAAAVAGGLQATSQNAAPNASAQANQLSPPKPPALVFDTTSPLVVQRQAGSALTTTVFVKNEGTPSAAWTLSLSLVDADERPVADPPTPTLDVKSVGSSPVPGTLTIPAKSLQLPARGYLVLTTIVDGKAVGTPASREIRLLRPMPSSRQWQILVAALIVAMLIGITGYRAAPTGSRDLDHRMGAPVWGDSWASNIAVGGALLTFVVNAAFFPEQTRFLPKVAYSFLSLFWTTVVALAPAVYGTFRTPVQVRNDGVPGVQYQGFVGIFMIASVLTLWGAFGQLATTFFATAELDEARIISPIVSRILFALNGLLTLIALFYAFDSIRQYVERFGTAPADAAGQQPLKFSRNLQAAAISQLNPPLESWHLL